MKPVFLNFTNEEGEKTKTFTACSLKTGMMDNIFDLAERADDLEKTNIKISEVRQFYNDLKALVLEVFSYKFSFEELNEHVETEELMRVFNEICSNIAGDLKKN